MTEEKIKTLFDICEEYGREVAAKEGQDYHKQFISTLKRNSDGMTVFIFQDRDRAVAVIRLIQDMMLGKLHFVKPENN